MDNIRNIFVNAKKVIVATVVFGFSFYNAQGIFITEIADPGNDAAARFVELYNGGTTDFDLGNAGTKYKDGQIIMLAQHHHQLRT